MAVFLLNNSLKVEVFVDKADAEFEDDICVRITEDCAEDEKIFYGGETNLYLTREQAQEIIKEFQKAISGPDAIPFSSSKEKPS
ncbi:hypothetical protein [Flexilinea flocculi]|jgi:hypothetical protein|uniref:Uncharacterized protein n=1 Tax=Flexilinea flocculi TaxID=1678840 RepID=A0A0K8PBI8_9CHLR|nr:hypothetical protein [Flexilinea flocculi]GAP40006.1 hypothetical protein ATC1_12546 [Flexilinea flocculi]